MDFLIGRPVPVRHRPRMVPARVLSHRIDVSERGRTDRRAARSGPPAVDDDDCQLRRKVLPFTDVTIEPRPPKMPDVWVAGGARIPDASSTTTCRCSPRACSSASSAPTVALALLRQAGVGEAATGSRFKAAPRAWRPRRESSSRTPTSRTSSTPAIPPRRAQAQQPTSNGDGHAPHLAHLEECYLFGTIDDIVARLATSSRRLRVHRARPDERQSRPARPAPRSDHSAGQRLTLPRATVDVNIHQCSHPASAHN